MFSRLARPRADLLRGTAIPLALTGTAIVLFALTTPPISFNDGLGFDGQSYAAMARALRDGQQPDVRAPFAYRIVPVALVAYSQLPIPAGFLLMNLVSYIVSAVMLVKLLRRHDVTAPLSLLGVVWWLALPAGLRLALYYPVLTDGIGFAFLLALLLTAIQGRFIVFAVLLPFALLTRENLILLIPFLWLANIRMGLVRATRLTLVASIAGVLAFAIVRIVPPIPPTNGFSTLDDISQNWRMFSQNARDVFWRFLAAPPLTLGLLAFLPFIRPRRLVALLQTCPAWAYYVAATVAIQPIGGGDFDRFALWLSPFLVVATFHAPDALFRGVNVYLLTAIHLLAVRFLWPTDADRVSYLMYNVATMSIAWLLIVLAFVTAAFTLAFVIVRRSRPLGP